jgi:hypothetical protein
VNDTRSHGDPESSGIFRVPQDLLSLVAAAGRLPGVWKSQLRSGDTLVVRTKNSFYVMAFLGDQEFAVSGGWFAAAAPAPAHVTVNGCTWGGRAILTDLVAAPGLFLEFGNGVRTTRIQAVSFLSPPADTLTN